MMTEPATSVGGSVLVVDDDLAFGHALRNALLDYGLRVFVATSMSEALKVLQTTPIDLLITDLVLVPSLVHTAESGVDLIRAVKQTWPELPIAVISGYALGYTNELAALDIPTFSKADLSPELLHDLVDETLGREAGTPLDSRQTSPREALYLDDIRQAFAEEAQKLLRLKERTLTIPGEGQYDLLKPLVGFKREIEQQILRYPFERNVFLMMKFRPPTREIADYINETLQRRGYRGVRADDHGWNITSNVYNPIAVLYCCRYGIALFDEPEEQHAFSPNVAYELGMMHQQGKECLIVKHSSLPQVPFDLVKDLYVTYDRDLQLAEIVSRWLDTIK